MKPTKSHRERVFRAAMRFAAAIEVMNKPAKGRSWKYVNDAIEEKRASETDFLLACAAASRKVGR